MDIICLSPQPTENSNDWSWIGHLSHCMVAFWFWWREIIGCTWQQSFQDDQRPKVYCSNWICEWRDPPFSCLNLLPSKLDDSWQYLEEFSAPSEKVGKYQLCIARLSNEMSMTPCGIYIIGSLIVKGSSFQWWKFLHHVMKLILRQSMKSRWGEAIFRKDDYIHILQRRTSSWTLDKLNLSRCFNTYLRFKISHNVVVLFDIAEHVFQWTLCRKISFKRHIFHHCRLKRPIDLHIKQHITTQPQHNKAQKSP